MKFDMVVWDESTYLKNHQSKRSQANYIIGKDVDFKLLLSGTPYTESLTDLYSQFKVLDGGATFGSNYYKFFRYYYVPVLRYQPGLTMFRNSYWKIKAGAHDEIKKKLIGRAIRFVKEDCLDLPGRIFSKRWGEWNKKSEQYKDYSQLEKDVIKELTKALKNRNLDDILFNPKDDLWVTSVPNILVKMNKLQQIAGGWYYTGHDSIAAYNYKPNPKLEALFELLEECLKHGKVVIFSHFIHDRELIKASKFGKYMTDNEWIFNTDKNKTIFLSGQMASGMGLNLQVAHQMIYYTNHWGLEKRLQSRDRIYRMGQHTKCLYYDLMMRDSIDETILNKLDKKWNDAQAVIDWVKMKT